MDSADLAHLLRRTEFVVRPERLDALAGATRAEAVDDILDVALNGVPDLPVYFQSEDTTSGWNQYVAACSWWLDRMVHVARPVQEKLTLFWHGHFTSGWEEAGKGFHLMLQNHLYRQYALGDFRELAQRMAVQPAMLVYLSNADNVKAEPNQNFARELMELFTLGVGNYTEDDVDAAARAWTGHNALWPDYQYVFRSTKHDSGDKTFFGTTKNWNGPDIIDEIVRDNPAKRQVMAKFISRKVWEFLAHPGPPPGVVDRLASDFLASGLDIATLVRSVLTSDEFYLPAARTGLVRTPIEFFVALMYYTGVSADDLGVAWRGERLGQQIFQPPNVAGWKANGYWLTTSAINGRAQCARSVTWMLRQNGGFDDLNAMATDAAVDRVAEFFGVHPLSTVTRDALIAAQQAERNSSKWGSWWAPTNLLTMMMLTPEFHMA